MRAADVEVAAAGDISFWYKVSSEATYDYLRFYIDGIEIAEWEGEEGWAEFSYPVSSGSHTFKWAFEKDYSVSSGSDCGWIDYIEFPTLNLEEAKRFYGDVFGWKFDDVQALAEEIGRLVDSGGLHPGSITILSPLPFAESVTA